jgi:hypothetical protein
MIERSGRASRLVVNSSRVKLERRVRGINGNGDGLKSDGVEESGFRSRSNIGESSEGGTNVVSVESARVRSSGGVRIRSFSINSFVGYDVLESLIH